jgi:hypothetical protein
MAGLYGSVSQHVVRVYRSSFVPEMNPQMSGDPLALAKKLRIDATLRQSHRNRVDSKASNGDTTLHSRALRLNVKYRIRDEKLGPSLTAGLEVCG